MERRALSITARRGSGSGSPSIQHSTDLAYPSKAASKMSRSNRTAVRP